jgi:lauroyl/myristoyl acyltransferase
MSAPPPAAAPSPAESAPAVPRLSRKRRSALRDRAELLLFRVAARGLALLPPAAARRAGRAAARAAFSRLSSRRRILLRNLSAAYPDDPAERIASIAAASIDGFASALVDFLETGRMSRDDLLSRVSIVGEENLRAARARG